MFISVLGLGQGGGNLADEFAKRGYYTGAINYSQTDLNSLSHVDNKLTLIGSEGVGKQRNVAIELMSSNWDLATNFVKENYSHPSIEIILVPFSTAGGSGSGIAPLLLNLLSETMPNKTFVAMPIIPDNTEVYKNKLNCLDTFQDLSDLDCAILPIDNDNARTSSSNVGRGGLYKNINENVANTIDNILHYTDQHSKHSVLDKKDLLSIFKTKGYVTIAELNLSSLTAEPIEISETSFAQRIEESWSNTPFANIQLDQVVSTGIIFDGQERLLDLINTQKLFSPFSSMPLSLYEGYYNTHKGKLITILAGLSVCRDRLTQIENDLETSQNNMSISSNTQEYKPKKHIMSLDISTKQQKQHSVKDISNIINKFKRK